MKNWADEIRPDTVEGDIETVSPSESDLDIGKQKLYLCLLWRI
jgi:hypothetical protein